MVYKTHPPLQRLSEAPFAGVKRPGVKLTEGQSVRIGGLGDQLDRQVKWDTKPKRKYQISTNN
jgi:hypothetical protein